MLPVQSNIELPLLKILADSGRAMRSTETYGPLGAFFPSVTADDWSRVNRNGEGKLRNRVRFALKALKEQGQVDFDGDHKLYAVNAAGRARLAADYDPATRRFRAWQPQYSGQHQARRGPSAQPPRPPPTLYAYGVDTCETRRGELVRQSRALNPKAYELLCGITEAERLNTKVTVVGRSWDGGADGVYLYPGPHSIRGVYQSKNHGQAVGTEDAQKFLGAINGRRAQCGTFYTTARFDRRALAMFNRSEQKAHIVRVDGPGHAALMDQLMIGVTADPDGHKNVNPRFFDRLNKLGLHLQAAQKNFAVRPRTTLSELNAVQTPAGPAERKRRMKAAVRPAQGRETPTSLAATQEHAQPAGVMQ